MHRIEDGSLTVSYARVNASLRSRIAHVLRRLKLQLLPRVTLTLERMTRPALHRSLSLQARISVAGKKQRRALSQRCRLLKSPRTLAVHHDSNPIENVTGQH